MLMSEVFSNFMNSLFRGPTTKFSELISRFLSGHVTWKRNGYTNVIKLQKLQKGDITQQHIDIKAMCWWVGHF